MKKNIKNSSTGLKNDIIRAVLYIRVSTEEQVRNGFSLDAQKERLTEYCKQKGYKIINIYVDEGKSARSHLKSRKSLLNLLEDAKENEFDRIIFWKLDRWFRNISDYYEIQKILEKYSIDWECSDEEYNTTTSNGRLHLNIKLSIAQNESDQTSDRIKFAYNEMIRQGCAIFGTVTCPLGYKVVGEKKHKKIVKNDEQEELTNYIFSTFENTQSLRKTSILVREKYNYDVTTNTIKKMCKNTLYFGKYNDNDNYCPAYITKEKYEKIQEILPKNVKCNKKHEYIFSSLLICKYCNTRMYGTQYKKQYPTYRCTKYKANRSCRCANCVKEEEIESFLLRKVADIKEDVIRKKSLQKNKEKTYAFDTELEKLVKRKNKLSELYLDDKIDKNKYYSEYESVIQKIEKLNAQKRKTENKNNKNEILHLPNNFKDLYNKLNNENKRIFWRRYIDTIVVDPYEKNLDDKYNINLK